VNSKRHQFQSTYGKSYAGMPQGFDPNSAFSTDVGTDNWTKDTEIRENFDNERSIIGVENEIRGTFVNILTSK